MKFLPWQQDRWLSKNGSIICFDKLEHFAGSFILAWILSFFLSRFWAVGLAFGLGFFWEVKDGYYPYNRLTGAIEGFSWKDLIADMAGIGLYLWV